MRRGTPTRLSLPLLALVLSAPLLPGKPVAAVGKANFNYLERKFADGTPKRETYVFMVGNRFDGGTVDHTFERMSFREIVDYLAPKLTQQNYWPTKEVKDADLVIVVHWGVTMPRASLNEMTARISLGIDPNKSSEFPASLAVADFENGIGGNSSLNLNGLEQRMYQLEDIADNDANRMAGAGAVRLLGYGDALAKLGQSVGFTPEQYTLEADMRSERYFIIVRAFDLRATTKFERNVPVWTVYLNTASPGNNFRTAMASMSTAGAGIFGRNTDGVVTFRPKVPAGHVGLPDIVIIGEAK